MDQSINDFFDEFDRAWLSPAVARERVGDFSGGLLTPKYLANLDAQKLGPPRIKIGHKVAYPKKQLIEWMRRRAS